MEKNNTLEFLKFFAALLITNSHFGIFYGKYSFFATGGAIGDSLFFFCSGFALSLSKFDRFDNWYKRRIFRIYPSIIAKDLLLCLSASYCFNSINHIINGGGWFLKAIMLFYIIIYFQASFLFKWLNSILIISIIFIITASLFFVNNMETLYSSSSYFAWCTYFTTMLLGLALGKKQVTKDNSKLSIDLVLFFSSVVVYYGILFLCKINLFPIHFGILSILPLYGILISLYKICKIPYFKSIVENRFGVIVIFISTLCWEIYLAQIYIILPNAEVYNRILPFPSNIIIAFLSIIAAAYLIKILSKLLIQLFIRGNFDWRFIVETWK